MKEDSPITDNELSSELTGLNKNESNKKINPIIISAIVLAVIIIVVIIIIVATSGSSDSSDKKTTLTKLGEISCVYDVKSISKNTFLLSNEFNKISNFDI